MYLFCSFVNNSAHESAARTGSTEVHSPPPASSHSRHSCVSTWFGLKMSRNYSTRPQLANLQLERDQRKCTVRHRRPAPVAPHVSRHDCRNENITRLVIIHSWTGVMFTQYDVAQLNNSKMFSFCYWDKNSSRHRGSAAASRCCHMHDQAGLWWCLHVSLFRVPLGIEALQQQVVASIYMIRHPCVLLVMLPLFFWSRQQDASWRHGVSRIACSFSSVLLYIGLWCYTSFQVTSNCNIFVEVLHDQFACRLNFYTKLIRIWDCTMFSYCIRGI